MAQYFFGKVDSLGRVYIPSRFLEKTKLNKGESVVITEEKGKLTITSKLEKLKKAQDLFIKATDGKKNLTDDFLKFRREESKLEK